MAAQNTPFVRINRQFWGATLAMSRFNREQLRKKLDEAEGYLMLDLPRRRSKSSRADTIG